MDKPRMGDPGYAAVVMEGSLFERMLDGEPLWPEVELPGWDEPIRIRPLSRAQELACHARAQKFVASSLGLDLNVKTNQDIADEYASLYILYEALVTADSTPNLVKQLHESFQKFVDSPILTDVTRDLLFREYTQAKLRQSAQLETLPDNVRDELIVELKKNPQSTSLDRLPQSWQVQLIRFMASQQDDSTGSK